MKRFVLLAALLCGGPAAARPVVVELFTSEACSSCPPAEALLRQLKTEDPDILPLSFHVTYWNGPGWTDKFSFQAATDRQNWYAALARGDLYTPEAVVDGTARMVGSDAGAVTGAIGAARRGAGGGVAVSVRDGATVAVSVGASAAGAPATVWLVGYDPAHTTRIGGGENGGATIMEVNVVRSLAALGRFTGAPEHFAVKHPAGMFLAVLVQRADGAIVGAAR